MSENLTGMVAELFSEGFEGKTSVEQRTKHAAVIKLVLVRGERFSSERTDAMQTAMTSPHSMEDVDSFGDDSLARLRGEIDQFKNAGEAWAVNLLEEFPQLRQTTATKVLGMLHLGEADISAAVNELTRGAIAPTPDVARRGSQSLDARPVTRSKTRPRTKALSETVVFAEDPAVEDTENVVKTTQGAEKEAQGEDELLVAAPDADMEPVSRKRKALQSGIDVEPEDGGGKHQESAALPTRRECYIFACWLALTCSTGLRSGPTRASTTGVTQAKTPGTHPSKHRHARGTLSDPVILDVDDQPKDKKDDDTQREDVSQSPARVAQSASRRSKARDVSSTAGPTTRSATLKARSEDYKPLPEVRQKMRGACSDY